MGPIESVVVVPLDSGTLSDDWTDAELCYVVATNLGVPPEDVTVDGSEYEPWDGAPEPEEDEA